MPPRTPSAADEANAMDHHKQSVNKFTGDDRFFSAIGRFIFEFSQLEYTLKHHVAEQIDLKEEYFTAVMTHDFAVLCTITETVLLRPGMADDRAIRLKKLINKCLSLNEDRVRIVHGLWFVGGKEGRLFRASKGKIETKVYYERADEVAQLADLANSLCDELPNIVYGFP
jgi:hypothetical protein